jgi:hypothetical protein
VAPHVEESAGQRDPEILAARETSERGLRRWRRRFGERRSGVEEEAKGYLHPDPMLL